ncbi:MAG: dUTP diphosphatase, partial [Bdellovibrionota bacterium]|nr:dUTP diphosphatase [Bdellovibrionota bacterium]
MERSVVVKVKKLAHFDSSFCLPTYESLQAAGADLRVSFPNKESLTLAPGEKALLPTGLSLEIPEGFEVQVRPRSGL